MLIQQIIKHYRSIAIKIKNKFRGFKLYIDQSGRNVDKYTFTIQCARSCELRAFNGNVLMQHFTQILGG